MRDWLTAMLSHQCRVCYVRRKPLFTHCCQWCWDHGVSRQYGIEE